VHFFDIFTGWFGEGRVVGAQRMLRPGTNLEEQVNCSVRYREGTVVNFYHGFTQPNRMDRQEFRLLFERGDVRLEEWVPVRARIHAVADEKATRDLMELFPGAQLDITSTYGPKDRPARARHKSLDIYQMIEVTYGLGEHKMHRYGELLRTMLRDQVQWVYDRNHVRRLTHENGRQSLAMAIDATRLADKSQAVYG
jgi:hypothetical protein